MIVDGHKVAERVHSWESVSIVISGRVNIKLP